LKNPIHLNYRLDKTILNQNQAPFTKGIGYALQKSRIKGLTCGPCFANFKAIENRLAKGGGQMSNILGIIGGVIAIIVGLIFLIVWWSMFVKALMAVVPILLILIGLGLLVYFISEIKSKLQMKKEEPQTPEEKKP